MRSEIKGAVTITEGPVEESQAFTMNDLGATGGFRSDWGFFWFLGSGWLRQKQDDGSELIPI